LDAGTESEAALESWTLPASAESAAQMRLRVERFGSERGIDPERLFDIKIAVTEAATNAARHAYAGQVPGPLTLVVGLERRDVLIEVRDEGSGIAPRIDSPGLGIGLSMIGSLADSVDISAGSAGKGTVVRMLFRESLG
jgi:serine/threonine-protein kinase RsbW